MIIECICGYKEVIDNAFEIKLTKALTYFTFFSVFNVALAQSQNRTPNSLFIDKPVVKTDSLAILKVLIKEIVITELFVSNSSVGPKNSYDTILVGKWILRFKNSEMQSVWTGNHPNFYPVSKSITKGNKIIETIGQGDVKFELIHYLDKAGQIKYTINKSTSKFETRYGFRKINYLYKDGLLIEAQYFIETSEPTDEPYMKYIFIYVN